MHAGPHTFATKTGAQRWLATVETDLQRGVWVDPRPGRLTLDAYSTEWMKSRELRPTTRELYDGYLRVHISPVLGGVELAQLSPTLVRRWHYGLVERGVGVSTVAKSYRLLRAMLNTAVADEVLLRNPCRVAGAGIERAAERPVATVEQVWQLADVVPDRFRCLVLLAGFVGLRRGELFGLERRHIDLLHGELVVEQQQQELKGLGIVLGPPKTEAGIRRLVLPRALVSQLERHLETFSGPASHDRVFVGEKGGPVRELVWEGHWKRARTEVGLVPGFRFHDLRHTANTLTASTGASTRELMHRLGHASPAAALRYQHATHERDAVIAEALNEVVTRPAPEVAAEESADVVSLASGTRVARRRAKRAG